MAVPKDRRRETEDRSQETEDRRPKTEEMQNEKETRISKKITAENRRENQFMVLLLIAKMYAERFSSSAFLCVPSAFLCG
jgi:hypothetical protein